MLLALFIGFAPRLRHPLPPTHPVDFNVYYSAATLVREGHGAQIYSGADTGGDPQKVVAGPSTPIFRAAEAQGLSFVGLYVYPPILADLLVPLTFLPLAAATPVWLGINAAFVLLTAWLVGRLLRLPLVSPGTALIFLALCSFTPVLQCFVDGQITVFLLLLWAAGLVLLQEDLVIAAGVVFALATAIKLTPALVIVPFLLWRSWRFILAFLASLCGLGLFALWVNAPQAFIMYFRHVMPAMSGAIPFYTNFSLAAATQRLLALLRTGGVGPFPDALPASTVLAGRLASIAVFALVAGLLLRAGRSIAARDRVMVIGLLSLVAPILSPVSWFHAYAMAFVAFAILWRDALQSRPGLLYLLGLTATTVLLGTAVSENLTPRLLSYGFVALACFLQVAQLALAIGIVCYRLWRVTPNAAVASSSA